MAESGMEQERSRILVAVPVVHSPIRRLVRMATGGYHMEGDSIVGSMISNWWLAWFARERQRC